MTLADGDQEYPNGLTSVLAYTYIQPAFTYNAYRYHVTWDTQNLLMGGHYYMCIDVDGTDPTYNMGSAGPKVYVTGILTEYVGAVQRDSNRKISFTCTSCTAASFAYLTRISGPEATGCYDLISGNAASGVADAAAENTRPLSLTATANSSRWEMEFTSQNLYRGELYTICLDIDGNVDTPWRGSMYTLTFGDTGAKVYINTVEIITPRRMKPLANQKLLMLCGPRDVEACYVMGTEHSGTGCTSLGEGGGAVNKCHSELCVGAGAPPHRSGSENHPETVRSCFSLS